MGLKIVAGARHISLFEGAISDRIYTCTFECEKNQMDVEILIKK